MTLDPRNSVRPGQRLSIAADQINFLNRMMRGSAGISGGPIGPDFSAPYTWVYAQNNSGDDAKQWDVLGIGGMVITPTATLTDAATRQYQSMPVLNAVEWAVGGTAVCVAVEPISENAYGRVAVAGAVQVKAAGLAKLREFASVLWKDSNWALVLLGGMPVRLGKTTATWTKGTGASIELYEEGTPPYESRNAGSSSADYTLQNCVNKFSTVQSGKWVVVAKASNGKWYLIAAEC